MLENYKMTKVNIVNMEKEIEYLENYSGIKSMATDGIGGRTNLTSDITGTTALSNMDKKAKLQARIDRAKLEIDSIDRVIEGLNSTDRKIIKGFYIDDLMWWQVAYSVGYSEGHCKKRRVSAINEMGKGIYGIREK